MAVLKKGAFECALVEAVGTFLFALAIFQTRDPYAIGLILMAALYMGTHAHVPFLNTAVSFGEYFGKKIDLVTFFMTLLGQVIGAIGAAALSVVLGGNPVLAGGMATQAMGLTELITSFLFVSVVMSVLSRKAGDAYGLVIGLTATGLIMLGGLFNPAIAIGVMLYNSFFASMSAMPAEYMMGHLVAYVLVPFVGAVLAVMFHGYAQGMKR